MARLINYFAYGSNMHSGRLRDRLKKVSSMQSALLADHRLVLNKLSRDGSAKFNVEVALSDDVYGALYCMPASMLSRLDAIEGPGYTRVRTTVLGIEDSQYYQAWCYKARAPAVRPDISAYAWYLAFAIHGAKAHALPEHYIDRLEKFAACPDPNRQRQRIQQRLLDRATCRKVLRISRFRSKTGKNRLLEKFVA